MSRRGALVSPFERSMSSRTESSKVMRHVDVTTIAAPASTQSRSTRATASSASRSSPGVCGVGERSTSARELRTPSKSRKTIRILTVEEYSVRRRRRGGRRSDTLRAVSARDEYLCYTDGSCKAGEGAAGGWGFFIKAPDGPPLEGYGK